MLNFLTGYKTYIVGFASITGAIAAGVTGSETWPQAIQVIITAILAMTVRNGVSTAVAKVAAKV